MRVYRVGDDEGREKFDICNCLEEVAESSRRTLSSGTIYDPTSTPQAARNFLLKQLRRLLNITQEVISTEVTFVHDMLKLQTLLQEWKYSTLPKVHEFVHSAAYVGICTSTETIWRVNTLFLEQIKAPMHDLSPPNTDDIVSLCDHVDQTCRAIFNAFHLLCSLFPIFATFIAYHDDFTILFSTMCTDNACFNNFVKSCELMLGESTLSLVIKPVQRLPRYVMLCRELHRTLEKCSADHVDPTGVLLAADRCDILPDLYQSCVQVVDRISACVHTCNGLVQEHQDAVRMHELHALFVDGGTDVSSHRIVVKGRVIIKEGELRRHHKHGGIRSHRVQLFSDALLSSSVYGKGLHLEQYISLAKNKDTICYSIPSPHSGSPSTWFVVISEAKRLYFSASSHDEMMRWVSAIHSTLVNNETDSDFYLMRHQVAIVNIMITEMNSRKSEVEKRIDRIYCGTDVSLQRKSASYAEVYAGYSKAVQASWWQLVDLLDSPLLSPTSCALLAMSKIKSSSSEVDGDRRRSECEEVQIQGDTSNLERVIDNHMNEVIDRIEMSIECCEADCVDGKTPIEVLLRDQCPHYLIGIGVFFEYPQEYSGSMETGDRPALLKLFLLHDVLIGAYVDKVNNRLHYSFNIKMENLDCTDVREGVGDMAILLADSSHRAINKRRGTIFRSVESHSRLIYAPSVTMKMDWLCLMMQTLAAFKMIGPAVPTAVEEASMSPKSYLKSIPLQELVHSTNGYAWTTKAID